jgi:hypothetical protein
MPTKNRQNNNQQNQQNQPKPKTPAQRARAARRRQRVKLMKSNMQSQLKTVTVMPSPMQGVAPGVDTAVRTMNKQGRLNRLTPEGVSYLKCAFAPVDFAVNNVLGVPDGFEGMSLIKRHRLVQPLTLSSGQDYYVILVPIPGIAYASASKASLATFAGNETISCTSYADSANIFGTTGTNTNAIMSQFRFVSNHIELVCTTNQMTWSGNIQCMKAKLSMVPRQGSTVTTNNLHTVSGLEALNYFGQTNQYTAPLVNGVYSGAYNYANDFPFTPVMEGITAIPNGIVTGTDFCSFTSSTCALSGIDNHFESVIIKISGLTTNVSMILKTWACVEYQVTSGSMLYEYQTMSPSDYQAIALYREIIKQLPIAVGVAENPDFWRRVLGIIRTLSGVGMALPGPYGSLAAGVNLASNALAELTL